MRGILESRAEMLALRDDVQTGAVETRLLADEVARLDAIIPASDAAVARLQAEQHGHEKSIVGFDAQVNRTADELARVQRRLDVVSTERAARR